MNLRENIKHVDRHPKLMTPLEPEEKQNPVNPKLKNWVELTNWVRLRETNNLLLLGVVAPEDGVRPPHTPRSVRQSLAHHFSVPCRQGTTTTHSLHLQIQLQILVASTPSSQSPHAMLPKSTNLAWVSYANFQSPAAQTILETRFCWQLQMNCCIRTNLGLSTSCYTNTCPSSDKFLLQVD